LRPQLRFALLPLIVVLGLLSTPASSSPQDTAAAAPPEAMQREIQAVQDLMARAVTEFEGSQQSRSIVVLDEIAQRLEALRGQGTLPPRGRDLLVQAYELRARVYFASGLTEKASESFRLLVQVRPDHALSKEKVSPKVIELFNSLKKSLVGYLAVASRPAGAKVTVAGPTGRTEIGVTDFFPVEVLAGDYTVEVEKEGYQTETRTISIAPRGTEALNLELTRTLASAFFLTEPAGVEIWVDGVLRATTGGVLPPEMIETVRSKGLDPGKTSGRTEVGRLSLGSHVVEFRRKCYETDRLTLETTEARDYEYPPLRLEDSVASLRLTSDPPGARILLNGEVRGVTPSQVEGICSGPVRVEVKHAAGRFIQDIVLQRNDALSLDCPIRPSLSFLGVVSEGAGGESFVADAEDKIRANLSKVRSLNFLPAPRETVDRILESEKLTRKSLLADSGADVDVLRRVTEKLKASLEVQGFLVGLLPDERLHRTVHLHLLAAGNAVAEAWPVVFSEAASYTPLVSRLDQRLEISRPWTGLITVDTLLHQGVPILRVAPGSPAAASGLQSGLLIQSVDGKLVAGTVEILAVVAAKKPGERISVQVKGAAGESRLVDLVLGETPQEIPLHEPTILYNRAMMDLLLKAEGYPGTEQAAFAQLNLAIASAHFGDFAAAHDHLTKAKADLPVRAGLSQGTGLYYLGLALERLGYKAQAIEAYKAASAAKDATMFSNDGPAVAPIAARRATVQ
jgi:hypothetical protein